MDSTFTRALVGFVVQTVAVAMMSIVALWAIETFAGGAWFASLVVVVIALVVEIMIYSTTLRDPVYRWINEPERREEEARRARDLEAQRARDNTTPLRPV